MSNPGQFKRGQKAAQKGDEPRTAIIHMRVTRAEKAAFVRAANAVQGRTLTDWMIEAGREKIDKSNA